MILSVASCYDYFKALSASGLCNIFDMGVFFFFPMSLQPGCSAAGKLFQPKKDAEE